MVDSVLHSSLNPSKKMKLDDSLNNTSSTSTTSTILTLTKTTLATTTTVEKKPDFLKLDGKFSCVRCRFNHKSAFYFDYHMETVHQTSLPICFKCNSIFKNQIEQKEHCLQVHANAHNSMFGCFFCAQSFVCLNKFDGHIKLCHGPECAKIGDNFPGIETSVVEAKTFQCSICPASFVTKQHRDNHVESKHLMLSCLACQFLTRSSSDLNLHFQNVHFHRCRGCDMLFMNVQKLKDHIKTTEHSQNKLKNNVEKVGTISKAQNINNDLHQIDNYITAIRYSQKKLKKTTEKLVSEKVVEAQSQEKNIIIDNFERELNEMHPCSKCSKKFTGLKQLQLHTDHAHKSTIKLSNGRNQIGSPKNIFQCSLCFSTFECKIDLSSHTELNHPRFNCFVCPLLFSSAEEAHSHMINVHRREFPAKSDNQLKLGGENEKDSFVPSLYKPIQAEVNSKNIFQCSVCSSRFGSRMDLNVHIDLQHPLFKCPICPLSFRSAEKVQSHVKNIHQQEPPSKTDSVEKEQEKNNENQTTKKSFIRVQYFQIDAQDISYQKNNYETPSNDDNFEEGFGDDVKDIEIDENFIVDEFPVNATDKNTPVCQSINGGSDGSTEMKQELENLTSHVKIEDFVIKNENVSENEKEYNEENPFCPVCKMIIPSDLLLSNHIESEHLTTPDPNENPAIAEFL